MLNWTKWNRILYSGWAPFYDFLVCGLESKRQISLKTGQVRRDETVLLLGAGTGLDLKYLPIDCDVTAIDITPGMVTRLEQRAKRLGRKVKTYVMDGQKLEFANESFDVVILHFVLAVIPDPERAIREAERVLRPGGRVLILNKFVRDDVDPSFMLRCVNHLVKPLMTDITVSLGPIVRISGMKNVYEKSLGYGGHFKVAILQKGSAPPNHDFAINEVIDTEPMQLHYTYDNSGSQPVSSIPS